MSDAIRDTTIAAAAAAGGTRTVSCPFTDADGRACPGHIVRLESCQADLSWVATAVGLWRFTFGNGSPFQLYCSEKGRHAEDGHVPESMKRHFEQLPEALQQLVERTERSIS